MDAKTRKLEDKIRFLQKEAEAFKKQSYAQSDLLLDLVPPLSRLGHAANAETVDAALELARGVNKNSQDVDAIREVADAFLSVYKQSQDSGRLEPHDTGWRKTLAAAVSNLALDPRVVKQCSSRLLNGDSLQESLKPLCDALKASSKQAALDASTCERLATMIGALPLENSQQLLASKLSSRLRGFSASIDDLDETLDELASLLGQALQNTVKRDKQMQRLVTQMSGELTVVEGFLGTLNQRDDASLEQALTVQSEVVSQSQDLTTVFDNSDSLDEIKTHVVARAQSIRSRMDRFVADAKAQRQLASQASADLSSRLASAESEVEATRQQLLEANEKASTDFLTGLCNRLSFEERLQHHLDQSPVDDLLCCIIWDVDHFKKVNDTYGHLVGDRVLKAVACVLKERVGEKDLAARLGGEEFVTVIRKSESDAVLRWANSVRNEISQEKHDADSCDISVSVSCGIAQYQRGDSLVSILARADKALYQAKDDGRDQCAVAA